MGGKAWRCVAYIGACALLLGAASVAPSRADTPAGTGRPIVDLPNWHSAGADLSFYYKEPSDIVESSVKFANDAIRRCNREDFDLARYWLEDAIAKQASWLTTIVRRSATGETSPFPLNRVPTADDIRRVQHDLEQLKRALEKVGQFVDRCPPKQVGGLFDLFLQGGGTVAFQTAGFFQSLDSTPPREQITTTGGSGRFTGLFGGGVRVNVVKVNPDIFFEARFQTAFGAPSFQQTFAQGGPNAFVQAPFGESLVRENWGIPLLLGATWSLGSFGPGGPAVGLDVYGGITIANWTQSLQGGEAGVAGTPGFSAQQTRTSIDPTFGVGLRLPAFDRLVLGLYGEVAFRQGSSVTAVSPSAGGPLTYTGSVDTRATGSLMMRLSVPFGSRALFGGN